MKTWITLLFLTLLALFTPQFTFAGLMEISAQYSTRSSQIDENNYSETVSTTGSFAWYFFEMSALELSYTSGEQSLGVKADGDPDALIYHTYMNMYGADLVLTFAGRESVLQPFIKGGIARVHKTMKRENLTTGAIEPLKETEGNVPSYGAGIKINITKTISLKGSYDRWRSSDEGDREIWDDAVRAGLSFYF